MPKTAHGIRRSARRAVAKAKAKMPARPPAPAAPCHAGKSAGALSDAASQTLNSLSSAGRDAYQRVFGERYSDAITISGNKAFRQQVKDRLDQIAKTPSGQEILKRINQSGKQMKIVEFTGDNSFAGPRDFADATAKGLPVYDGAGTPINSWLGLGKQKIGTGKGTDSKLELNPNLTLPNSLNGPLPNDAVLFHEMVHGSRQMQGIADFKPVSGGWDTNEEQVAISSGTPSEADYLRERNPPYNYHRLDHDTTFRHN